MESTTIYTHATNVELWVAMLKKSKSTEEIIDITEPEEVDSTWRSHKQVLTYLIGILMLMNLMKMKTGEKLKRMKNC